MEEILGLKAGVSKPSVFSAHFFFLSYVVLPTTEEIYIAFIFREIIIPLLWINKELGICLSFLSFMALGALLHFSSFGPMI